MAAVNVYEAKTHLSRLLRRVRAGEEIIIADNGEPVAKLVPFRAPGGTRELGGDEKLVTIADDFDAPLPDDVLAGFYGDVAAPKATAKRRPRSAATPAKGGPAKKMRKPR